MFSHATPPPRWVGLYHQRWEHESAYYVVHTITNGRNLPSGDPAGIQQEIWSLLNTARDRVIQAAGIVKRLVKLGILTEADAGNFARKQ